MVLTISRNPVMYGQCVGCGRRHRVTAGANNDVVDLGEQFGRDYCCKNCVGDRGATPHVRVRRTDAK